jgi:hypothetical protein
MLVTGMSLAGADLSGPDRMVLAYGATITDELLDQSGTVVSGPYRSAVFGGLGLTPGAANVISREYPRMQQGGSSLGSARANGSRQKRLPFCIGLWGYWNRTLHKIVYADRISVLKERQ